LKLVRASKLINSSISRKFTFDEGSWGDVLQKAGTFKLVGSKAHERS